MDPWRVLQYKAGVHRGTQTELDDRWIASLPQRPGSPSVVFAMPETELARLKRSLGATNFSDRGTKDPVKQLSRYVTRRDHLVALSCGYKDAGQAERGIQSLLNWLNTGGRNVVFLAGVSPELFEQIRARATTGPVGADRGPNNVEHLRFLLDTEADPKALEALRRTYLGGSDQAEIVRRLILRAANATCPVLIQGESGTGKEVVADQINRLRVHSHVPMITANCGGIPEELFESEMFGHVKGSFTDAIRDRRGLMTLAGTGTLFLDEIGDLSLRHQVKLLRAIEAGEYLPVGAEKPLVNRARIIAATNRDLDRMVAAGQFREDLYYRLFYFRIRTPALRDHLDDIEVLANHFWQRITRKDFATLPRDVIAGLRCYSWPGNARELKAFLNHLYLFADNNERRVNRPLLDTVMLERGRPPTSLNDGPDL